MLEKAPKRSVRQLVVVGVLTALALASMAAPASAAKGGHGNSGSSGGSGGTGRAATSMTFGQSEYNSSACAFDATYTWGGVKGGNLTLAVQLLDSTGAVLATTPHVVSLPGDG